MSDSRLEKFIYAICSMDVSDLPVPLSRIEKLWNCLITGETPDFEPLSRNEKYLMAMLDRYDISNLPAPMSRGEKLLYKIAVGETDLSDVPGYLSRYEELLKYLIENGGISGGDFEYVLYTLNQSLSTLYTTAEKPVKRAILKGDSQRVFSPTKNLFDGELEQGTIDSYGNNINLSTAIRSKNFVEIGVNTAFTVSRKKATGSLGFRCYDKNKNFLGTIFRSINGGILKKTYTTDSNTVYIRFIDNTNDLTNQYQIEIGSTATDYEEPNYVLKSVKMPVLTTTGKNLFDKTKIIFDKLIDSNTGNISDDSATNITDFIKVIPNTQYTMSFNFETSAWTRTFGFTEPKHDKYATDVNGASDKCYFDSASKTITFTTSPTTKYLLFSFGKGVEESFQLEQGSTATSYEPYKSNILTVNEDITLRGIGDVKDTLDLLTGEVTESIGEIVLDGTQYMVSDGYGVYIQVNDVKRFLDYTDKIACDKLPVIPTYWELENVENGISGFANSYSYLGQNWLYVKINNSVNKDEVKEWMTQNPITVQYQRVTDSIKTVDLTIVDQDNQPTQLGTFENITHVSLEAENLIPEVEMEVSTIISEELASASPLMDDISTKQQQLEVTVDEQSNNVDATMIATTEIYEETL